MSKPPFLDIFSCHWLTKGGVLSTDTHHEHVKRNFRAGDIALDLGVVANVDNALLVIDLGGLRFVILDGALLVTQNVPDGFHDGAMLDQTGRAGRQQGGEKEEVSGGDDDDIVVFCVELLEQGDGAPSSAWEKAIPVRGDSFPNCRPRLT